MSKPAGLRYILLLAMLYLGQIASAQCTIATFVPPDTLTVEGSLGSCSITTREILAELELDSCQGIQLIPGGPYDVPATKSLVIYDQTKDSIYSPFLLLTRAASLEPVSGVTIDTNGLTFIEIGLAAGECTATKDMLLDQLNVPDDEIVRSQVQLLRGSSRITDFRIGDTTHLDVITCDGSFFYQDIDVLFRPSVETFSGFVNFDIGITTCEVTIEDVLDNLGYDVATCGLDEFRISDRGPFGYGQHFIGSIMLDDYPILESSVVNVTPSGCFAAPFIDFGLLETGKCALNEYDLIDTLGYTDSGCGTEGIVVFPPGPYETSPVKIDSIAIGGTVVCTDPFEIFFFRDTTFEESGSIVCHQDLNIAMNPNCSVMMNADVILSNSTNYCYLNYNIDLAFADSPDDIIATGHEVEINVPGRYSLTITNPATGVSCWSEFSVEDKFIEDYRCAPDTLWCYAAPELIPDDTIGGGPRFPDLGDGITFTASGGTNAYNVSAATLCGVALARYEDNLVESCQDDFKQIIDRVWTLEDNYGNSDTCTQRLYIRNTTLDLVDRFEILEVDCISDFVALDEHNNPTPEASGFPTIRGMFDVGVCGTLRTTYNDTEFPLCGLGKKIVRDWVLIDWCSDQVLEMTQIIRVEDKKAPEIIDSLDDLSIDSDPFICGGTNIDLPLPNFTDCNVDEVILEVIYETYDESGRKVKKNNGSSLFIDEIRNNDVVGTFLIEYILTDPCGNESRDSLNLTISDTEPPVAVCDEFTIISVGGNGNSLVKAETFDNLSVDNCGIASYQVRKIEGVCHVDTAFTDDIRFCCEEVGDTILIEFKVTDVAGNFNICEVSVSIQDKFRPIINCPDDILLDCGTDYLDLTITGEPIVRDNCDNLEVTFEDQEELSQCYQGVVNRTWTVKDQGGFEVTCVQVIRIEEDEPFNMTQTMFPSDTTIMGCNASLDPEFTGSPVISTSSCAMVDATYNDLFFYDVDNACVKVLREWTIIDWCQRDENNSGIWKEDQIIKLESNIGPVFTTEERDTSYCINDAECADDVTIIATAEDGDACTPADQLVWSYNLFNDADELIQSGEGATVSSRLESGPYYIIYQAKDGCDNTSLDTLSFDVVDCTAPDISCPSVQPSLVLDPSGVAVLAVSDVVDITIDDNCDDPSDISLSFLKEAVIDSIVFTCDDLVNGISDRFVKIYAIDQGGNLDSCELFLEVRDNSANLCGPGVVDTLFVAGVLKTREKSEISGVAVTLSNGDEEQVEMTDETGAYRFDNLIEGEDYKVTFEKNTGHDDGVTTLDILITQQHILALRAFESPYQTIAADTDNNGRITVLDLVRLRRLVLGQVAEFDVNGQQSWRFVDASQEFESVRAPFPFIEELDITFLDQSSLEFDFMGVKIGDVNGSNSISSGIKSSGRSGSVAVELMWKDGALHFVSTKDEYLSGLQLNFENYNFSSDLEISSAALQVSSDNYLVKDDEMIISWTDGDGVKLKSGETLFSIQLENSQQVAELKDALVADKSEWINDDLTYRSIRLEDRVAGDDLLTTHQIITISNAPNPFVDFTNVYIDVVSASTLDIQLVDITGKVVLTQQKYFEKGRSVITIDPVRLNMQPGLFILTVEDGNERQIHKLSYVQ